MIRLIKYTAFILFIYLPCLATSAPNIANNNIITGNARIIDGDSLIINSHEIRLFGVDAPEFKQHCYYLDGKKWPCGETAAQALRNHTKKQKLTCNIIKKDQYKRILAECYLENSQQSLNAWLVENGWAVSYKRYTEKYQALQEQAKKRKDGIWAGYFLSPEKWRIYNKRKGKLDK